MSIKIYYRYHSEYNYELNIIEPIIHRNYDDNIFYIESIIKYKYYYTIINNINYYHRIDGPAFSRYYSNLCDKDDAFLIKGNICSKKEFANITKHLICKYCKEFCKQRCFI